jgi:hypothetical protein
LKIKNYKSEEQTTVKRQNKCSIYRFLWQQTVFTGVNGRTQLAICLRGAPHVTPKFTPKNLIFKLRYLGNRKWAGLQICQAHAGPDPLGLHQIWWAWLNRGPPWNFSKISSNGQCSNGHCATSGRSLLLEKIYLVEEGTLLRPAKFGRHSSARFPGKNCQTFFEKFDIAYFDLSCTGSGNRWKSETRQVDAHPGPLPPCGVGGRYPPPLIFGEFSNLVSAKIFLKVTDTPCLGRYISR